MSSVDRVPFHDLDRSLKMQREKLLSAAATVVDSGWLVHGKQHSAFEAEFSAFIGSEHVIGVASGTDALELSLRALAGSKRSTVVTVANAGGYTTAAAIAAGLEVRYVDVDPRTHCLDHTRLEAALDDDVMAIVVTHLYGRLGDVAGVREVIGTRPISIVEDCAQASGAFDAQGRAGSLGDLAAFSFYPTKNLGALGDGGAIATSDNDLAERIRHLRQYGWIAKYDVGVSGGRNSRLDELQAAFLRTRLPQLSSDNERRRAIISEYRAAAPPSIRVLPAEGGHAGHLAVVVTDSAQSLARHMEGLSIGTAIHYPIPDHRQRAWKVDGAWLPVTDELTGRVLSLPCFPEMTSHEVAAVCNGLRTYPHSPAPSDHRSVSP